MMFVDARTHHHRLLATPPPPAWSRVDVQCPACRRIFVAQISPRDDAVEARLAARTRLLRGCPDHADRFTL